MEEKTYMIRIVFALQYRSWNWRLFQALPASSVAWPVPPRWLLPAH